MKGIWILTLIASFIAGSIATGVIAFADDDDDGDGGNAIVTALNNIADAIDGLTVDIPPAEVQVEVVGVLGPPTSFYIVQGPTETATGFNFKTAQAQCSTGDSVTGGGIQVVNFNEKNYQFIESYPSSSDTWTVRIFHLSEALGNITFNAYAICADLTP